MHIFSLVMSESARLDEVKNFFSKKQYEDNKGVKWPVYVREVRMFEFITQEKVAPQLMADMGIYRGVMPSDGDFHFSAGRLEGLLSWIRKLSMGIFKDPPAAVGKGSEEAKGFTKTRPRFYSIPIGILPCEHFKEGENPRYDSTIEKV